MRYGLINRSINPIMRRDNHRNFNIESFSRLGPVDMQTIPSNSPINGNPRCLEILNNLQLALTLNNPFLAAI